MIDIFVSEINFHEVCWMCLSYNNIPWIHALTTLQNNRHKIIDIRGKISTPVRYYLIQMSWVAGKKKIFRMFVTTNQLQLQYHAWESRLYRVHYIYKSNVQLTRTRIIWEGDFHKNINIQHIDIFVKRILYDLSLIHNIYTNVLYFK